MKKLIEWAEGEVTRARKLMLFTTVFTYLLVTVAALVLVVMGKDIEPFLGIYYSFTAVAATAIGFYTGTSAKLPSSGQG
ncbi:MAG: hypothetical protein Q9O24_01565 [Gammaproteobacteria bacterium]|nr:hypothetical protein [Gammaproteobacteria bacterium]MDQ7073858.1 hypothetical protein [Gammaproteobacteria bacterium]